METLNREMDVLKKVVGMSEGLTVPAILRDKAEEAGVRLKFGQTEKHKKKIEQKKAKTTIAVGELVCHPTVTYTLFSLRAYGVISRMGTGEGHLDPKEFKYVSFTFTARDDGGWTIAVVHLTRGSGKEQMLFDFQISQRDLEQMRHAGKNAKRAYNEDSNNQGFVTINCFNLLQLLGRIASA